jgi:hypothetical protein
MPDIATKLTAVETRRRSELEATIAEHVDSFTKAGAALAEMRDSRLYRDDHESFDDYCRSRWGMGASRARQLISAAEVTSNIGSVTIVTPANEAQTRPLASLSADEQRDAWKESVDTAKDGKVTAKHVENVVRRRVGNEDPSRWTSLPNDIQRKVKSGEISIGVANAMLDAKQGTKDFIDNAPLRALEKAEAERPREWNGRPIPADAPPLDLDVSGEPSVQWASMVSYFQTGISRLPDKSSLKELPDKKRKYIADRFRDFAKALKEAV